MVRNEPRRKKGASAERAPVAPDLITSRTGSVGLANRKVDRPGTLLLVQNNRFANGLCTELGAVPFTLFTVHVEAGVDAALLGIRVCSSPVKADGGNDGRRHNYRSRVFHFSLPRDGGVLGPQRFLRTAQARSAAPPTH